MLVPIATELSFPDDRKKNKVVYGQYLAGYEYLRPGLFVCDVGTSCMQQWCFAFLAGSSASLEFVITLPRSSISPLKNQFNIKSHRKQQGPRGSVVISGTNAAATTAFF